jgi:NADH-quinone oxidoreductase subunit N
VAAVNTVASLYYYLRWLAPVFAGGAAARPAMAQPAAGRGWPELATVSAAVGVVALGLLAGPALDLATTPLLR